MKTFYIVDAFATEPFGGNPAGVVILNKEDDFPSDIIMTKTAAELRYSETAFVKPLSNNEFNIRYFTPNSEVDLCGHATIGSFSALEDAGLVEKGEIYKIQTLAGIIEVQVTAKSILMDMAKPEELSIITETRALKELYNAMGITYDSSSELLPSIVSTGLPDIILPVKNDVTLSSISPDFIKLTELSKKYNVTGVHAFTMSSEEHITAYCRNFAPLYEIDEEAATGTANGALTYYLYKNKLLPASGVSAFLQGREMQRSSLISTILTEYDSEVKIRVGGSSTILAKGSIYI